MKIVKVRIPDKNYQLIEQVVSKLIDGFGEPVPRDLAMEQCILLMTDIGCKTFLEEDERRQKAMDESSNVIKFNPRRGK